MLSRATVLPGKTKAKLWTFDNTLTLAQKFGVQGRNSLKRKYRKVLIGPKYFYSLFVCTPNALVLLITFSFLVKNETAPLKC